MSITLILGGARSGKSRRAEELALAGDRPVAYVATCPSGTDPEMRERIAHHRASRPQGFKTVEDTYDLGAIAREHPDHCLILDCLTLWLFVQTERQRSEAEILAELETGLKGRGRARWVIVSNEIGLGVVPLSAETRAFRDLAGRANQRVAALAEHVELMVAGVPLIVKQVTREGGSHASS